MINLNSEINLLPYIITNQQSGNDYYNTEKNSLNSYASNIDKYNFRNFTSFPIENLSKEELSVSMVEKEKSEKNKNKNLILFELLINKKRGRKKKKKNNSKLHNSNTSDNVLRKIQVHYLTFIIKFLNNILTIFNIKQKFCQLEQNFKRNVNKKHIEELKEKTLGELVCNNISKKYKKYTKNGENKNSKEKQKNPNELLYEKVIENPILNNILSEKNIDFFQKIYYKSKNPINLKEYGYNKNIKLSNVKMYRDLLKKNEKLTKNFDDCLLRNFLTELHKPNKPNIPIFLLH